MNLYKNKNLILSTLSILLLSACGPSPEEIAEQERLAEEAKMAELKRRSDLATVTCNFMAESRNMDAAMRIKEINSARERLGENLYLGTDAGIKESFEYGLCRELVLNDPDYNSKLLAIMEAVAERERLRIEEERIRAEEARIAREKKAEEERIAKEKKAEEERIVKQNNIAKYTSAVREFLKLNPPKPAFKSMSFEFGYADREVLKVVYSCENFKSFDHDVVVVFKNDIGEIRQPESIGYCSQYGVDLQNVQGYDTSKFPESVVEIFYTDNPKDQVEKIYLEWNGRFYLKGLLEQIDSQKLKRETKKILDPELYGLDYSDTIDTSDIKTIYQIYP